MWQTCLLYQGLSVYIFFLSFFKICNNLGPLFFLSTVLYAVDHVEQRDTRIRFALDLYRNKLLDVELPFSNPFSFTTALGYNPRLKVIQLLYSSLLTFSFRSVGTVGKISPISFAILSLFCLGVMFFNLEPPQEIFGKWRKIFQKIFEIIFFHF